MEAANPIRHPIFWKSSLGMPHFIFTNISKIFTFYYKVWYHKCESRGKNCNNSRLLEQGGCSIWYNEMQVSETNFVFKYIKKYILHIFIVLLYLKVRNFLRLEIFAELIFAMNASKNLNFTEFNFAFHIGILYKFFENNGVLCKKSAILLDTPWFRGNYFRGLDRKSRK